ncbi:MAG: O-antigen ligase family protein, partial [Chloroflexota bacterium]|nr:O-antigen ligase family protein [Chloroflexota bacterium]
LAIPLGCAALAIAAKQLGALPLANILLVTQSVGSWQGREEVWSRAIYMMQDFPYTGVGMGTFNRVANIMYPFFLAGPEAQIPHAHNLFLQVGVDLGYPGLIAYLAMVLVCIALAWRSYGLSRKRNETSMAALAVGLLGSFVALVVHGLTDAASWGTKPAVIQWAIMGLAIALHGQLLDRPTR